MIDRIGQQLGNYQLVRFLGRGGFAEVYLGEHIFLKKQAAIKVLQSQVPEEIQADFLKEARLIASLEHPHIVRLLDFGVEHQLSFLIMSYAPNGTLRQRHREGSRLPLATIVTYLKQVASALQYAHEHNVIHRDVKPQNMLIGLNDEILLSDFGLAIAPQSTSSQHMQNRAGTLLYMAPEQFEGKAYPASDQYALGVVVYEWLCGEPPFQGTYHEIAMQHQFASPPALHENMPAVPAALKQVMLKALAKDPKERFASMQHFVIAFEVACQPSSPAVMVSHRKVTRSSIANLYHRAKLSLIPFLSSLVLWSIAITHHKGGEPWLPHKTQLPVGVTPAPSSRRPPGRKQLELIAVVVSLLVAASALLVPILLAQPGKLATVSHSVTTATIVGHVFFTSSGQLDPTSSEGLNDVVHIELGGLTPPAPGKSDDAWLLPDTSHDEQQPVFLGALPILRGSAQLTYISPMHANLLATYSRFLVTEQAANEEPIIPSLDLATWRYAGSIPDIPTPGDANHYSLLSHLRHLLAKDPTIELIGLSGGLDIWLYRNADKILEWSSAARDDWAGGQASLALMRRQIERVLDYLDGANFAWRDVPPNTPLLVDPKAGRIGLLEFDQGQTPPGYLAHVDFHLVGYTHAPGVTADQKRLATKIDAMLTAVTALLWKVHGDATLLARMSDTTLLEPQALSLLDDMDTNATDAFVGQPNPATGSVQGGVTQMHDELQLLATIEVSRVTGS